MKDIPLSKFGTNLHFKKVTAEDLRQDGSFNLVDEKGNFVAILVLPASAEKRFQIQSLCSQMNSALGKE